MALVLHDRSFGCGGARSGRFVFFRQLDSELFIAPVPWPSCAAMDWTPRPNFPCYKPVSLLLQPIGDPRTDAHRAVAGSFERYRPVVPHSSAPNCFNWRRTAFHFDDAYKDDR